MRRLPWLAQSQRRDRPHARLGHQDGFYKRECQEKVFPQSRSATINAGSNISVSNVSVTSSTQITAMFTPTNSASAGGNQGVTVTVNNQTSSPVNWYIQIPTSLSVLSDPIIPTGSPGGCTATADYGIRIDIKYQTFDQQTPAQTIASTNMIPFEDDVFPSDPRSGNICPSSVPDCTLNTAADGSWHDAPVGSCFIVGPTETSFSQTISMLVGAMKYQVRVNNYKFQ